MLIPCKEIAMMITQALKSEVSLLKKKGKKLQLVTFLIGQSSQQLSFVKIKKRVGQNLGIGFSLRLFQHIPPFENFLDLLRQTVADPEVSGVIIQHPLPKNYDFDDMYAAIPSHKEIEGHTDNSPFVFPLSLAVLTGLKYVYGSQKINDSLLVNLPKDNQFFRQTLKNKKLVLAGRGPTGGKPIGRALQKIGLNFTVVHSQTTNPKTIYQQADVIITATGKKIITPSIIKKEVVLLNVGLRRESNVLKGDYDEPKIAKTASYYTATPGGLGPIDVLYLYKNLIDAAKMH